MFLDTNFLESDEIKLILEKTTEADPVTPPPCGTMTSAISVWQRTRPGRGKPHRDKQNISSQLDSIGYDLKEIREDADKSDAQTKTEIEWQIKRMLLLGLSCLQLGGSISLSLTVAEPTVGQAISY